VCVCVCVCVCVYAPACQLALPAPPDIALVITNKALFPSKRPIMARRRVSSPAEVCSCRAASSGLSWVTIAARWGLAAAAAAYAHPTSRAALDRSVAALWQLLLGWPPASHALAEAVVATCGFWAAGSFFELLHLPFPSVLHHRLHASAEDEGNPRAPPAGVASDGREGAADAAKRPTVLTSAVFFFRTKVRAQIAENSAPRPVSGLSTTNSHFFTLVLPIPLARPCVPSIAPSIASSAPRCWARWSTSSPSPSSTASSGPNLL